MRMSDRPRPYPECRPRLHCALLQDRPRAEVFPEMDRQLGPWAVFASPLRQIRPRPWLRSHCENIAQDPADACSRALKGFDERRMIVRLDLEGRAPTVANIHDAGILTRWNDYARAGGG